MVTVGKFLKRFANNMLVVFFSTIKVCLFFGGAILFTGFWIGLGWVVGLLISSAVGIAVGIVGWFIAFVAFCETIEQLDL